MPKEMISARQAFCIIAIFIWGSSVVIGGNSEAGHDAWITLVFGFALAIPMLLVYARIMRLYPEKNLFDVLEAILGKAGAKILIAFVSFYALHLCAIVLCNFSEFIEVVAMPETPQLPLMIIMMAVTSYLAISGVETLGRWAVVTMPVIIFVVLFTVIAALNYMDFTNILPLMDHDLPVIAGGSFKLFSFPFAELVLFLGVADAVKKQTSPYKLLLGAGAFGALVLLIVMLRNVELLGSMIFVEYFSSYIAARIISVGDFFARIEGSISMNFVISGITKITLCLFVAARGISYLFGFSGGRRITVAVAALTLALAVTLYGSVGEMFSFINVYPYYAMPFEVFIPAVIWLLAEIKTARQKKLAAGR